MSKTVEFELNEDGTVSATGEGFTGNECDQHIEPYLKAIGAKDVKTTRKAAPQKATVKLKQGR